ncbi:MAG TPA: hypothetical protein VKK79_10305, partial [Candidatus Lokiarchaeia archaeon]|nr:hypothetical protein [Candidatus Lokiarchaeia archaeon]
MQSRRSLLVASTYIMLALLLGIVNLVAGIASELPGVSLNVVLTQPVLSNYRVTFLEAVLDFQKFTGDVYASIIFSLFVAGYCAFYQRPSILPAPERNHPPRRVLLFGILAIG